MEIFSPKFSLQVGHTELIFICRVSFALKSIKHFRFGKPYSLVSKQISHNSILFCTVSKDYLIFFKCGASCTCINVCKFYNFALCLLFFILQISLAYILTKILDRSPIWNQDICRILVCGCAKLFSVKRGKKSWFSTSLTL